MGNLSIYEGKKRAVQALWRDFFSNTSEWWDHRPEKINARFPDFKHKKTGEALWLADPRNPQWVEAELAAVSPGILQSNVFGWCQRLKRYVKAGQYIRAMESFHQMQQERICPDSWTFLPVLNACAGLRALKEGRRIHNEIIQVGCDSDVYVATGLVDMYVKCGSIGDAWRVFNNMPVRDVVCWSTMIGGCAKSGQGLKAIRLFETMQQAGLEPNSVTFVGVLNACASVAALEEGRQVHEQIIRGGCETNVYVANSLVHMYAKCGSIQDAWTVFNKTREHNVGSWGAMIGAYVTCGQGLKAMKLFQKMQQEGVEPNPVTFVGVLNACATVAALEEGKRVHEQIIRRGYESDVYVATCLVDMYAKCGSIEDAWSVFYKMHEHNVVSWNAMIGGYVKSGQGLKAIELYRKMQQEHVEPSIVTFVGVLNACACIAALELGRHVHEQIIQRGFESDVYVGTCLVDMYAKCGTIENASCVFNKMSVHDVVSWNAMIGGYMKSGQGLKAMECFRNMQLEGVEPNAVTFVGVLNACASIAALEEGRHVHELIIRRGWKTDVYVDNCLVDMYAKCGSIEDAWMVFTRMRERNVVSWSSMIWSYVKAGQDLKAMELFRNMQEEGVEPDEFTFVGILNACASLGALGEGRLIHEQIIQRGSQSDHHIATCLVAMYAKCQSIEDAWNAFNKMQERDVVSWSAMIGAYVKCGQGQKAMELFGKMQEEGVEPNAITFVEVLNACARIGNLEEGRRVHEQIIQGGCGTDDYVATCLVDMYGKCGSIEDAWSVFNKMQEPNVVSWSAMIGCYVKAGQGLKAIELFGKMQEEGLEPNNVTFVGMLNACASVAALEEGRRVHEQIIGKSCESDVSVAAGLVDMYAKCGSIEEAWNVFSKMRELTLVSCNAMIGGYAMHGQAKKAVGLFRRMDKEGVDIDGITFTSLLSACSHGGLVKEGLHYFKSMASGFSVLQTAEHYTCMVDLLGRAGWLEEAEEMTKRMPVQGNLPLWLSLLGACRIHGNIKMAERAAKQCWELDPENSSGHLLLSNICVTRKWDRSVAMEEGRLEKTVEKKPDDYSFR